MNGPQTFKDHISLIKTNEGKNCQLCRQAVNGSEEHLEKRHFKYAVHFKEGDFVLFTVPCFCDKIVQLKRSHWHCFKCDRILQRRNAFEEHLQKHGCMVTPFNDLPKKSEPKKNDENATSASVAEQSFLCCHCSSSFATAGSLRRHEREFHATSDPVFCVDVQQGVFITAKNSRGQRVPIHVQKSTTSQVIACEVAECREFMTLAKLSGKPGAECEHLIRVSSAPPYIPPEPLREESLKVMQEKGLISTTRMTECLGHKNSSSAEGISSVFPIFFEKHGYSGRFVYFSIYTGKKERWCLFGRTRVSFDKLLGNWYCLCKSSKRQYRCLHIYMAMWWLFQEREDLLIESSRADSDLSGDPSENEEIEPGVVGEGLTKHQLVSMTNYLWQNKKIPDNLPQKLRTQASEVPKRFEPTEETCPYCPGPTPPGLTEPVVVTKNASVYDIDSVKKGVTVCVKNCLICKTPVRFQEYTSGFHNFNNSIILTTRLCAMMTSALKTNTAIGRFLSMMEDLLEVTIHHNTLRKAIFHFWAMTRFSYDFSCIRCGHEPPIVIADGNWKVAFDLPVNLLKRPCTQNVQPSDLRVDVEERWSSLEKELICVGFCYETKERNPFTSDLSYSSFAPWLGSSCRAGSVLPKTEILKGFSDRLSDKSPSVDSHAVEDTVLKLLDSKKPSKSELLAACAQLGVSVAGSASDIINRLEELLLYKDIYPKMFIKLQQTGGGVLHAGCPHAIVYVCSPLWWQESARDHVDALLSFKTPPTLYISDVAGRVARHANNRTRQAFFRPFDGRLCDPTAENVAKASAKELCVHLPWVKTMTEGGRVQSQSDEATEALDKPHPITGTPDRFSLYDRFHQRNQKQEKERLRSLDLAPDLIGLINSSVAEQLNRELANSRYFLCQLKDVHFMFALRLVFHLHNSRVNKSFMDKMLRQTQGAAEVGLDGRLSLFTTYRDTDSRLQIPKHVKEKKKELVSGGGLHFSTSLFPILKENKDKLSELYYTVQNHNSVLVQIDNCVATVKDLQTLYPAQSIFPDSEDILPNQPWLTDETVNTRVAQLASTTPNVVMLPTYTFVSWWRDWITEKKISPRNVSCLKNLKGSDTVVFPRCVNDSENPEKGNHFILWVFCGQSHEIRVFDSMGLYKDIPQHHMEILCHAFSNTWKLADWRISYPPQWLQSQGDANNCGVFVCTMAEMELKGNRLSKEAIGLSQAQYLREYHATVLVKDVVVEDSMKKPEKPMECMAGDLRVCCFQKVGDGPLYPSVVKTLWVQCDMCLGWLHTDCAGVKETEAKRGTFKCGCDLTQPYTFDSTQKALRLGIENIISDQDIQALHEAFHNEDIKSCRFYLWKHPETSLKFKQHLKPKQCYFSESDLIKLADKIKRAVDADGDLENLNYIFDVMIPEVTILLVQRKEKICRYAVELLMASGMVKFD